ncbi:MAG: phosphoribosylformylglycinamidine synthase subunit PurQ, partial [Opitutales bacterium]|nr:phosphoribosylformylglycinamidine synthase subunit PurQ [Opitutales bacterium]
KGSHFDLSYGSIIVELNNEGELQNLKAKKLGTVKDDAKIRFDDTVLDLKDLQNAWENTLESVYPTKAKDASGELKTISHAEKSRVVSLGEVARPRVFIPVFPGTNCEYDSAKAFEEAGAVADIFVFKNRSDADIAASVEEMARRIKNSQIVMFPGGFSAGDEPAGSGKFIAAIFRNKLLTDAINSHIKEKKNLVLGICNGFQALIKLGLVPFGEVRPLTENSPTLTYNNISRHISCYATTRVASKLSPWFADCELGEEFSIPLSHGEGKFVAKPEVLQTLIKNGQVATQYVDFSGNARADIPFNPNGSLCAIEGITSPCGLVLGKMGHSERRGKFVGINILGEKFQPLFSAGVKYFA